MSKAIRSYPKHMRALVIQRRLNQETRGLGYWSAVRADLYYRKEEALYKASKIVAAQARPAVQPQPVTN